MKKILIPFLTLILCYGASIAQKVGLNDARKIAKNVYKKNNNGKETILNDVILLRDKEVEDTLLFIVPFEESGFVIVPAHKAAPPTLGHCLNGNFEPSKMPPGLLYLIDKYKYGVKKLNKEKKKPSEKVLKLWTEYLNNNQLKSYTVGTRLTSWNWGQSGSYNNFCPNDNPAGCTAVAMAQILRYWECRIDPTGTKTHDGLFANFGATTYDWSEMANNFGDSNNALLIFFSTCK